MQILIYPGIHPSAFTEEFVSALPLPSDRYLIFPSDRQPVYSPQHILDFCSPTDPVLIIAFSAGVVGAIAAARSWRRQGVEILALIAIDGWGVPLFGDFPIHRVSHDRFTHWSSNLLGGNATHFYADPPVEHLTLWREPRSVQGYGEPSHQRTTAATFIANLIQRNVISST